MKESYYNFFYPYEHEEGKYVAYNARSNALALIEEKNYKKLVNFREKNYEIDDEKLIEDLKKGFFLIDDDDDELALIRYNLLRNKYSTNRLGLTIAPTSDCNFRCIYCYEKNSINTSYMSEETQKNLINFIKNQLNNIRYLSILWYGGEPLLAIDIIEKLSNEIIELCNKYNVVYNSDMISNGYLLSKKNIETINKCEIKSIQITLDGPPKIHDQRRFLEGGKGTFEKIIYNLYEYKNIIPPVALRINVDKKNVDSINEIIQILKDKNLLDKVNPYLGYVENIDDIYDNNNCLKYNEFSKLDFSFNNSELNSSTITDKYPTILSSFCAADKQNSIVINSDGKMYKCWNDIGIKEMSVGDLNNSNFKPSKILYDYMLYDPTKDNVCSVCKFMPICMGGCPSRRIRKNADRCSRYKYTINEYIQTIAHYIKMR